jgi:hypothetical protein
MTNSSAIRLALLIVAMLAVGGLVLLAIWPSRPGTTPATFAQAATDTPTPELTVTAAPTNSTPVATVVNTPIAGGWDGTWIAPTMVTPVLTPIPTPTT